MSTYMIQKVRKDKDGSLTAFLIRQVGAGTAKWRARADVIELIAKWKQSVYTETDDGHGGTVFGERVRVITVGGKDYLRTDHNQTARDNLGNLPEG